MPKKQKYVSALKEDIDKLEKIRNRTHSDFQILLKSESNSNEVEMAQCIVGNCQEMLNFCLSILNEKDRMAEDSFMNRVSDNMEGKE